MAVGVDRARLESLFGMDAVGTLDVLGLAIVAPDSTEAACEVIRFAAQEGRRLLPVGTGRHLPPRLAGVHFDFALSTRRMRKVLEYEPAEMVLAAEAGVSLKSIAATAAPHGQRLGPDPWPGGAATLGGAVGADRAGLGRLRYGTWRDALLGARVVHADGRTSKTGGRVVKNVAGYDLGKLYVGSHGTLALLAEVNLRLVPTPAVMGLAVAVSDRRHAASSLQALHRSELAPTALLLVAGPVLPDCVPAADQAAVCVCFEGHPAAVRWQLETAHRVAGVEEWPTDRARAAWESLRECLEPRPEAVTLSIASLPVGTPTVLEELVSGPGKVWNETSTFIGQFGVGASLAQLTGLQPLVWDDLRRRLAASGARVALQSLPGREVGPWIAPSAAPSATLDLALRTKAAFDPGDRFAPLARGGEGP